MNSALQRARATLEAIDVDVTTDGAARRADDAELLARYVDAFQRYDMDALTSLIHEDATQSMPPFDMWLAGRDDILTLVGRPGIGCSGSRVIPVVSANGSPAFGQYKPSETGDGFEPWALQVLEIEDGRIVEFTFFLDTETMFPLFGLPLRLDAQGRGEPHERGQLEQLGRDAGAAGAEGRLRVRRARRRARASTVTASARAPSQVDRDREPPIADTDGRPVGKSSARGR